MKDGWHDAVATDPPTIKRGSSVFGVKDYRKLYELCSLCNSRFPCETGRYRGTTGNVMIHRCIDKAACLERRKKVSTP